MPRRRNPVARAAIMRKGGAHLKSRSGERAEQSRQLEQEVADVLEERQQVQLNRLIGKADESASSCQHLLQAI